MTTIDALEAGLDVLFAARRKALADARDAVARAATLAEALAAIDRLIEAAGR